MRKHFITAFCLLFTFYSLSAQTLFTYGNQSVTKDEFLKAYLKNNTEAARNQKALQEYLDLYIASRLKIKEAKSRGYDTLPQMVADLEALRNQIMPNYLNDEEAVNKLVNEAFSRSQKDIHVAHIFIGFVKEGISDTIAAKKKADEAMKALQKGESFSEVAKKYSDDPSAAKNGGDIGYITVFTLPYEIENLVYKTPAGKFSTLHKSRAGYHIIKNLGERKAAGRVKASQILIAMPPDAPEASAEAKRKADSIYNALKGGTEIADIAKDYSNDIISAAARGQMPEFGVGEYDPAFEAAVLSLKDGELSKPFQTSHGWHIVKRTALTPVATKMNDSIQLVLKDKVENNDRIRTTKEALVKRLIAKIPVKETSVSKAALWVYSDSILNAKKANVRYEVQPTTVVLTMGKEKRTAKDWIEYARNYRFKSDGTGLKPYPQVWNEFIEFQVLEYYRAHLEDYNPAFKAQIKEFADGNLFFEIMQKEIWMPAQMDSTALENYFNKHKANYVWNNSADAVVFYASDENTANETYRQISANPASWRAVVNGMSNKLATDSARMEVTNIPNAEKVLLKKGSVTTPIINQADNTASFAYIIQVYDKPEQKTYTQAKGLVINDYQADLEANWIAALKKKYPVKVNQKVWASILAGK